MAIQTRPASNNEMYDRWQEEVLAAAQNYRSGAWSLADKLLEGMDRFGENMFYQCVGDTGLSQHTIENYLSLARAFPVSRRRESVAIGIHDAVRKLPEDEGNAVLQLAEKYGWTREQVRDRVKAWKQGDLEALKAGWKPKPKVIEVEEAEVVDNDKPVMDSTAFGEGLAVERHERERPDFEANDANQQVMNVFRAIERLDLRMVSLSSLSRDSLRAAIARLQELECMKARADQSHLVSAPLAHGADAPSGSLPVTEGAGADADTTRHPSVNSEAGELSSNTVSLPPST